MISLSSSGVLLTQDFDLPAGLDATLTGSVTLGGAAYSGSIKLISNSSTVPVTTTSTGYFSTLVDFADLYDVFVANDSF